ncbi:IS630 family transposase (plasmid) [Cupriavidus sp. KK10]|jgi:LuxR family maltose regulon positive regulatory protein|uniref:IS630 family transposase n=1 Tax=Cupriavidus sp. KK10 TaxID=1478019 RepID=UPI001BA5A4C7|nr:IS630 family transposase [Cupriavidus sp. KK10]QUN32794.1 IS630 family transposase [Cupriavidus sp. KK10]
MRVAHEIVLTDAERAELSRLAEAGYDSPRLAQRARMVLLAAQGMRNKDIAEQLDMGRAQVSRWRERFAQWRLAGITNELPRGAPPVKINLARLAALTSSHRLDSPDPWSTRKLAQELGVSAATISRHWRALGQEPRTQRSQQTPGGFFPGGLDLDLAGLYMAPAEHAMAFSSEDPAQFAAHAPAPAEEVAPAPRRLGITNLLGTLKVLDGHLGSLQQHDAAATDWLAFLRQLEGTAPAGHTLHIIADNYSTNQQDAVRKWISVHPRVRVHFTATHASWLRMVQRFFREMTTAQLLRAMGGAHELLAAIDLYLKLPAGKSFTWLAGSPVPAYPLEGEGPAVVAQEVHADAPAAAAENGQRESADDAPASAEPALSRAAVESVASTKLMPPRVTHALVPRAGLMARLQEARRQRCVVIQGQAGSGKTSTLLAWRRSLMSLDYDVTWLSLSAEDNDPVRFFECLLASIAEANPAVVREAALLIGRGNDEAAIEHWVISLVQGLADHPRELVVMLDDLHHIDDARIFQALQWLLAYAPPNVHLALCSRNALPLSFERLRAQGRLTEIDTRDLRFSAEESERFLCDQLGDIDRRDAVELHRLTDGWVAGLQLFAVDLRNRRGQGYRNVQVRDAHAFASYFDQEVLGRLAPEDLEMLIRTAICNRFCAPLCAAMAGRAQDAEHTAGRLERLEEDNLFITQIGGNERETWYRLHPLLREVLMARLDLRPDADRQALHAAACAWFKAHGYVDDAVRHAVLAGDVETAAGMVQERAYGMLVNGDLSQLARLLRQLPPGQLQRRFGLLVASAYLQMYTSRFDEARESVQHIQAQHGQLDRHQRYTGALIRAGLALQQDDTDTVLSMAPELREIPPDADDFSWTCRSNILGWAFVYRGEYDQARAIVDHTGARAAAPRSRLLGQCISAMSLALEGRLEQAEKAVREVLARADASGAAYTGLSCMAAGLLADMLYELNDTAGAIHLLEPRINLLERVSLPDTVLHAMTVLSDSHWLEGRGEQSVVYIDRLEAYASRFGMDRVLLGALALRLRRHQQLGEMEAAGDVMRRLEAVAARHADTRSQHSRQIQAAMERIRAGMSLYLRDFGGAAARLEALLEDPRTLRQPARAAALRLQLAIAQLQLGRLPLAQDHLREGLSLGHSLGLVRTLLDACDLPQQLGALLHADGLNPVLAFYLNRLLAEAARAEQGTRPGPASAHGAAPVLSEREREILNLVAQAMPNKKIAMVLGLSAETVKWHLKNIYAKLGVSGRGGAAARLRDLAD